VKFYINGNLAKMSDQFVQEHATIVDCRPCFLHFCTRIMEWFEFELTVSVLDLFQALYLKVRCIYKNCKYPFSCPRHELDFVSEISEFCQQFPDKSDLMAKHLLYEFMVNSWDMCDCKK